MTPIYEVIKDVPLGQVQDVWDLIAQGYYSDLFFDKWTPYIGSVLKNNISLILVFAFAWQKVSRLTRNKWDDRASNWLVQKLTRKK